MTLPVKYGNRVKETTTTTGTGALTLGGAFSSLFQTFANGVGDLAQFDYEIDDGLSNWEVGQGTYHLGSNTVTRDVVEASSNAGALVNFTAGVKTVLLSVAASRITPGGLATLNGLNIANVKAYGAKGDGQAVFDGSMSASSTTLACTTSTPFKSTDVGKLIVVYQDLSFDYFYGPGTNAAVLVTTIASFTDSGHVVLTAGSVVAISNATVKWATDDTTAIQAAVDSLKTSGGKVYFPPGWYGISNTIKLRSTANRTDYASIGLEGAGSARVWPTLQQEPWQPASMLLWLSATGSPMIQTGDVPFANAGAFGVTNFRVKDLALDGNYCATGGLLLDRPQGLGISNVAVRALEPSGKTPNAVTTAVVAAPTDTPTVSVTGGGTTGGGLAQGNYRVQYCLVDTSGETTPGPESADFNVPALATPSAPTTSASGTLGTIPTGTYLVSVSAVNASGETVNSADAAGLSVTIGQNVVVTLPSLPTGATGFHIYMSTAGGARSTETRQTNAAVTTTTTLTSVKADGIPALNATVAGNGNIPRVTITAAPAGSGQRIYLTPPNGNTLQEMRYPATVNSSTTLDLINPNTLVGDQVGTASGAISSTNAEKVGWLMNSALHIHACNDGRANGDAWMNLIEMFQGGFIPNLIRLTGDRFGNVSNPCHMVFTRCDCNFQGMAGVLMDSTDNIVFIGCYSSRKSSGNGYSFYSSPFARSYQMFHLEAPFGGMFVDGGFSTNSSSLVYGYDLNNGEPVATKFAVGAAITAPTLALASGGSLTTGVAVFYVVEALDAAGNRLSQSVEATITPTSPNLTVTLSNYSFTGATSYKIWRGTTTGAENTYFFTTASTFNDTGTGGNTGRSIQTSLIAGNCSILETGKGPSQKWTLAAELICSASTTTRAGFNIPNGGDPTSPVGGDIWDSNQKCLSYYIGGVRQNVVSCLFSATANAVSSTKNTTVSLVGTGVGTMTLPIQFLVAGKTIRIKAKGFCTLAASGALLTFLVTVGGTTVCTSASILPTIAGTNVFWEMEAYITCRTTGASGTVIAQGTVRVPMTISTYNEWQMPSTGTTTINTTGTLLVDFQCTQSNATAQSVTCTNFTMEPVN